MDNRLKNVKRNIGWGAINSAVAILLPFLTRTAIIYSIGIEYTGLNTLFHSVLQILSFAELGVGSALVYSMYKPMAEGDDDKVCALLAFYRKCYFIIGIIMLSLGLILLPFIDYLIAGDVPCDINVKMLFIIYMVDNVIGYLFYIYKSALFSASQRVDWISRINIVVQISKSIIQVVGVTLFRSYYIYAIALPVTTMLNNLLIHFMANYQFPQYKCAGKLAANEISDIKTKIGGMFFQKIGSIILSSADTVVISAFLGLKVLGIYNGYYYIITALTSVLAILHRSLIPSVGNSLVKESKEKNYRDFQKFHFLYVWIVSWFCTCLLCLYQPFIRLWQGADNMLPMSLVVLFAVYFFTWHSADMSHIYREALGRWWEGKFIPLISSLINLGLNLIMVRFIGLYGILLSTIISIVFINVPFIAYVIFKFYFEDISKMKGYILGLIKYCIIAIIVSSITFVITLSIPLKGMIGLLITAVICVLIPNILYCLLFSHNEVYIDAILFIQKNIPAKLRNASQPLFKFMITIGGKKK